MTQFTLVIPEYRRASRLVCRPSHRTRSQGDHTLLSSFYVILGFLFFDLFKFVVFTNALSSILLLSFAWFYLRVFYFFFYCFYFVYDCNYVLVFWCSYSLMYDFICFIGILICYGPVKHSSIKIFDNSFGSLITTIG